MKPRRAALGAKHRLKTRRSLADRAPHPVQVGLDGIFRFTKGQGDRPNRLLAKVLQMEDAALQRRQLLHNDFLAASKDSSGLYRFLGRDLPARHVKCTPGFERLQPRSGLSKPAIDLVPRNPKDPDQQSGLPLIGRERAQERHKDFLGDVLGFSRVAQPFQGKAINPRKIGRVEKIEMLLAPREDFLHQFLIRRPRLAACSCSHWGAPRVAANLFEQINRHDWPRADEILLLSARQVLPVRLLLFLQASLCPKKRRSGPVDPSSLIRLGGCFQKLDSRPAQLTKQLTCQPELAGRLRRKTFIYHEETDLKNEWDQPSTKETEEKNFSN